jgi:hypothetical protein
MTSRPVLITMSILAGAQVLVGAASLTDLIGKQAAGLAIVGIAAVQAGIQFYVQGQVTPNASVAARRIDEKRVVTGPAAKVVQDGNANVGEPATVVLKPTPVAGGAT